MKLFKISPFFSSLLFLFFSLSPGCDQNRTPPYNVILISVDTLRPDHLGCYGYERDTSPNINRLAREGVLFENVISTTSWTLPAHMALFTSLYDTVHQVTRDWLKLDDFRITLAEKLKGSGLVTAGFYTCPYLHSVYGFNQGFDTYEGCMEYDALVDKLKNPAQRLGKSKSIQLAFEIETRSHREQTSLLLRERALQWLEKNRNKDFFLFLHFFDTHYDFLPPKPFCDRFKDPRYKGNLNPRNFFFNTDIHPNMPEEDLKFLISQYDGEIGWVDFNIGLILERLREYQIYEKTCIVFTSDHGEEFFEHMDKGHRKTLYDEVLKIPLIFSFPGKIPTGKRVSSQVRIIDIFPTIMDLLDLETPRECLGKSLVPLMDGSLHELDLTAFSELHYTNKKEQKEVHLKSLRTGEAKIIANIGERKNLYFNLLSDSREQNNLFSEDSPMSKMMLGDLQKISRIMEKYSDSLKKSSEKNEIQLEEGIRQKLMELGYLDNQ